MNILSQEEQRQKAIKQCLLRNPHAFHPKIGETFNDAITWLTLNTEDNNTFWR